MASIVNDEQGIEYVELLDVPVYANDNQEIIVTVNSPETNEIHQVIGEDEDTEQLDEVEYIEAEELDEQHTIIVHDGRQYIVPTKQLQQAGNTIVLEDRNETEDSQITEDNDQSLFYSEVHDESEVSATVGRQYAVLKDGKLHIPEIADSNSADGEDIDEMEQKLRVLQNTLNSYEDIEEQQDDQENRKDDDMEDEDETIAQITGKNLITGQTISLSGFLEKIRRKGVKDIVTPRRGAQTRAANSPSNDYVLVPPVNRRVVVGKTIDGRRLIGHILQIQKKVPPVSSTPAIQRRPYQRRQQANQVRRHQTSQQPAPRLLSSVTCSPLSDENVSRTLAGLMDLESVERSLAGRRLIVRHVQRRSQGGRAVPGTRRVAFYRGRMIRVSPSSWKFDAESPHSTNQTQNSIDITEDGDHHQVNVKVDEHGVVFSVLDEEELKSDQLEVDETSEEEPITVYLTVTQDEFGKKRTKVTIPQLANNTGRQGRQTRVAEDVNASSSGWVCNVCGKRLTSAGSLRRHAAVHDSTLQYLSGGKAESPKRFCCGTCGQQFHRHSNLLRHVEIHRQPTTETATTTTTTTTDDDNSETRRSPYICETCGCQYNFVSSLTRHIVNNHMNTSSPTIFENVGEEPDGTADA